MPLIQQGPYASMHKGYVLQCTDECQYATSDALSEQAKDELCAAMVKPGSHGESG